MQSREQIDATLAAQATAPRISLGDVEANITETHFVRLSEALRALGLNPSAEIDRVSLCVVVTKEGWVSVGKSIPVNAENFDASVGQDLSFRDARDQLLPLMGYALKQRLAAERAEHRIPQMVSSDTGD